MADETTAPKDPAVPEPMTDEEALKMAREIEARYIPPPPPPSVLEQLAAMKAPPAAPAEPAEPAPPPPTEPTP